MWRNAPSAQSMRASGRPTLLMAFPPNISQGKPHGVMVGWFSQAGGRHRTRGRRHGPAAAQRRSAPHSAGSYLTLTFHRVPSDIGVIRRERACNARKDRFNRQAKPDLCGWALDSAPRPIRRRFQAGWWGYLCQVVRAPRPSSCRSVLACRACRPRERRLRDLQGPDTSKAVVTLAPRPALPSAARILIIALTTDTHTCASHDCQRLAYDCIHTPNSISSMPIRNPFRRGPGGVDVHDENQRPSARGQSEDTGFQRAKTTGSKPVEILEKEYKLSGACLLQPPFQRPLHEIMRSRHHRRQPLIRHRDQRFWRVPAGTSTQSSLRYDPESGASR